jgi:DNA-binding response OmpR family regulator
MSNPTERPKRILVIDDDPEIARLLQRFLSTAYDVRVAADGLTGLREIHAGRPDLVISDVMMPGLTGFELARAVRAAPGPHPPVIFLTACDRAMSVVEGIQAGARHYLTKPLSLGHLMSKVKSVLEPEARRRPAA